MTSPLTHLPAPAPSGDPSATCLVECGDETLAQTVQGFLLVFRGRKWAAIARQLRSFDAEEWHGAIVTNYRRELDGLADDRLRDAASLIDALPDDALSRLDAELLDMAGGTLEFYNLLHSTTPFRVRARLQALNVLPMLKWEFVGMDDATDRIRRRIDAGKSVWDAFLAIWQLGGYVLQRFEVGLPFRMYGPSAGLDPSIS